MLLPVPQSPHLYKGEYFTTSGILEFPETLARRIFFKSLELTFPLPCYSFLLSKVSSRAVVGQPVLSTWAASSLSEGGGSGLHRIDTFLAVAAMDINIFSFS